GPEGPTGATGPQGPAVTTGNLAINGDMEEFTGNIPTGWTGPGVNQSEKVTNAPYPSLVHSKASAVRLKETDPSIPVTLSRTTEIELKNCYYKCTFSTLCTGSTPELMVKLGFLDESDTLIGSYTEYSIGAGSLPPFDYGYRNFFFISDNKAPETAAKVEVKFEATNLGNGQDIYIDDIFVYV
ncbi:MAG: hypothetical protein Q4F05_19430, partial [bacterium]|nr:hypothetical protein [bacterium]